MMSQNDGVLIGLTMSRYKFTFDTENIDSPPILSGKRVGISPGVPIEQLCRFDEGHTWQRLPTGLKASFSSRLSFLWEILQ